MSLPSWLSGAGFPLYEYLASAVLRSPESADSCEGDGIFCEGLPGYATEIVQRLARLTSPRGALVVVRDDDDGVAGRVTVEMRIAKRPCMLELPTARYPLGQPDRLNLKYFVEDLNRLLVAQSARWRVVVFLDGPRQVRMAMVDASQMAELSGVREVVEPAAPETLAATTRGVPRPLLRESTLDEILPSTRMLSVDSESVEDPSDYPKLLEELARRCPGGLGYDHASCTRQKKSRLLTVTRGKKKLSVELDDRGVIDPLFLEWVDSVLLGPRSRHRLVQIHSGDQCLQLAFATPAEKKALADASLLVVEIPERTFTEADRAELDGAFASLKVKLDALRKS
jgi:hypothetical protein